MNTGIIDFILGDAGNGSQEEFEQKLHEDSTGSEEAAFYQGLLVELAKEEIDQLDAAQTALENEDLEDWILDECEAEVQKEEVLEVVHQAVENKPMRSRKISKSILRIAAVLILGCCLSLLWLSDKQTAQNNKAFADSYEVQALVSHRVTGSGSTGNSAEEMSTNPMQGNYERGVNAFEKSDWQASIQYLNQLLENKIWGKKTEVQYCLAVAYLKTGQYKMARSLSKQILKNPTPQYHAQAEQILSKTSVPIF